MALNCVVTLALLGIVIQQAVGQWNFFGIGQQFPNPFQEERQETYITCIGKNTNKDQLRVTFREPRQSENRFWWSPGSFGQGVQMDAFIRLGDQSTTAGTFQLMLTRYSHVEDSCMGAVMGDVIDTRPLFSRNQGRASGFLGSQFMINNIQRVVNTEVTLRQIQDLASLNGRGIVMCPYYGTNGGGQCRNAIPLCCKCGHDSMNATSILQMYPMNQQGMGMGQGMDMGMGMNQGAAMGGGMAPVAGGLPGGAGTGTGTPPADPFAGGMPFKKK